MKTITKYVADDGEEFPTEEMALKRDELVRKVNAVMAPLGETHPDVVSGKGWVQHDIEVVNTAKDGILELCREQRMDNNYPVFKHRGRECHATSVIGRILSDVGGPLSRAWYRFQCIDEHGREHQQQYFAYTAGPDKEHVCIADLRRGK